jgi:protein-L-isoaspartate(D-aspartate) O-methyltransferase
MFVMDSVTRLDEREDLLSILESNGSLTDPLVEEAILAVPRHLFVPETLRDVAYEDRPLPVGYDQTISAPHMVAQMTCALQLERGQNVLEIGTGLGYHAAVLQETVGAGQVRTMEYLPELAAFARQNLEAAGSRAIVHVGDGYDGLSEYAPFDAILVTCAIPQIPRTLIDQLADGGHIVAPIGVTRCELLVARKIDNHLETDFIAPCLFVNAQGRLGEYGADDGMTAMT